MRETLSANLKAELDQSLSEGRAPNCEALLKLLRSKGCTISLKRPARAANNLERKLGLVRLVTEQATAVTGASSDEDNNLSSALVRLVQQHLFEMLVDLKTEELGKGDIAKIADSVAQMSRAAVMQQKWTAEWKLKIAERVGAAERQVVAEAKNAVIAGGLSDEAVERIRHVLMEIAE
jgi:hypothetical protein